MSRYTIVSVATTCHGVDGKVQVSIQRLHGLGALYYQMVLGIISSIVSPKIMRQTLN